MASVVPISGSHAAICDASDGAQAGTAARCSPSRLTSVSGASAGVRWGMLQMARAPLVGLDARAWRGGLRKGRTAAADLGRGRKMNLARAARRVRARPIAPEARVAGGSCGRERMSRRSRARRRARRAVRLRGARREEAVLGPLRRSSPPGTPGRRRAAPPVHAAEHAVRGRRGRRDRRRRGWALEETVLLRWKRLGAACGEAPHAALLPPPDATTTTPLSHLLGAARGSVDCSGRGAAHERLRSAPLADAVAGASGCRLPPGAALSVTPSWQASCSTRAAARGPSGATTGSRARARGGARRISSPLSRLHAALAAWSEAAALLGVRANWGPFAAAAPRLGRVARRGERVGRRAPLPPTASLPLGHADRKAPAARSPRGASGSVAAAARRPSARTRASRRLAEWHEAAEARGAAERQLAAAAGVGDARIEAARRRRAPGRRSLLARRPPRPRRAAPSVAKGRARPPSRALNEWKATAVARPQRAAALAARAAATSSATTDARRAINAWVPCVAAGRQASRVPRAVRASARPPVRPRAVAARRGARPACAHPGRAAAPRAIVSPSGSTPGHGVAQPPPPARRRGDAARSNGGAVGRWCAGEPVEGSGCVHSGMVD